MMHRKVFFAAVFVLTGVNAAAAAEQVADVLKKIGLIGTWATDCAKPASSDNYLAVYAVKGADVSRTYYDKPDHTYNAYKIVAATLQAPDMLAYTQVWDFTGKPADVSADRVKVLLNMADGKFQIVSSQGSDGSFFVKDRKFPSSGNESPWQLKCPDQPAH